MGLRFPLEYSRYLILHIQAVNVFYKLQVQFAGFGIPKLVGAVIIHPSNPLQEFMLIFHFGGGAASM